MAVAPQLEGEPEDWVDAEGTFVRPRSVELRTQSATVALHARLPPPGGGPRAVDIETQSDVRPHRVPRTQTDVRTQSTGWSLPPAPGVRRRRGLGLAALSLGAVAVAAALLVTRSSPVRIAVPLAAPPHVSTPVTIQPLAPPPVVAAPPAVVSKQTARPRAPARSPTPRALPKPSASGQWSCRVTLGTRPWSEVWIDGRKMPGHTPLTDTIGCGTHTITFKRTDLQLARSFKITLYQGEPFKQSFSLTE